MTTPALKQNTKTSRQDTAEMDEVLDELDKLKRQSRRLDLMNQLHGRFTGVLSITGMIEAYSIWLMPLVAHDLIGYNNNTRKKKHLFCSGHGPNRRRAMAYAEKMLASRTLKSGQYASQEGQYAYWRFFETACRWSFETADDAGILLILKEARQLNEEEADLINDSLVILAESLQRGLEYEELVEKATNDPLTGLFNRRLFKERIPGMINSAVRYDKPLTMVFMDLDKFKNINDNLGHAAGDEALKKVAGVFKNAIRASDLLIRMGGDEFLLILDNTSQKNAKFVAERLRKAVDDLNIRATGDSKLGVSIGLSELQKGESLQEWMERTDDILYRAKSEGRSSIAVK